MADSINSHSNNIMGENDRSKTNSIDSHINSKAGENDVFETVVLEDMCEQGSIDGVIIDGEDKIDENEIVAEHTENKTKSNHYGNTSKYDPSLNLPIALRKGTRSCTKHSISNFVLYENLSPQFRVFTTPIDSTTIPKSIHLALECPKWKAAVMEEMGVLEKNKAWDLYTLPKGHKIVGCKSVFTLIEKRDNEFTPIYVETRVPGVKPRLFVVIIF